jgi:hypothetical protein
MAACRTEDPGFESRQGVTFTGLNIHYSVVVKTYFALSLCVLEKNIDALKLNFLKEQ